MNILSYLIKSYWFLVQFFSSEKVNYNVRMRKFSYKDTPIPFENVRETLNIAYDILNNILNEEKNLNIFMNILQESSNISLESENELKMKIIEYLKLLENIIFRRIPRKIQKENKILDDFIFLALENIFVDVTDDKNKISLGKLGVDLLTDPKTSNNIFYVQYNDNNTNYVFNCYKCALYFLVYSIQNMITFSIKKPEQLNILIN
ncbi:hypothetical protein NGRA_1254 [Nosema granulosis]|uniref:Uncharacterized protein n=1 Tax=Nosema granulosis TaxID=83296 RepID=A0A9P6GYR9_9MICR|nr:hypothetical protein NGRA_1254 [Nosema granulosis]